MNHHERRFLTGTSSASPFSSPSACTAASPAGRVFAPATVTTGNAFVVMDRLLAALRPAHGTYRIVKLPRSWLTASRTENDALTAMSYIPS